MGEVTYSEEEYEGIMNQDHDAIAELLPAYALGALDDADARRVEAHLRVCPICQETYRTYLDTAHLLAYSVPLYEPPRHLRESIRLLTVPVSVVEDTTASKQSSVKRLLGLRRAPRPLAMLLLVFSLVTVGLAGWNVHLTGQMAEMKSETVDAHELAEIIMQYMEAPDAYDTQPVHSPDGTIQAQGMVLRERNGNRIVLIAEGLPRLGDNHMYQVWLYDQRGNAIPAREFRCDQKGRAVVIFEAPMAADNIVEIGVMMKPARGGAPNDLQPILDVQFRSDEGYPLMLAAAAL